MIKHQTTVALPFNSTTYESRFYPAIETIYLHSHTSAAPFMYGHRTVAGLAVEVYQPECSISQLRISVDIWASLAKVVIRYRMTAVAWSLGWIALILFDQLGSLESSGQSEHADGADHRKGSFPSLDETAEHICRRPLPVACLIVLAVLQHVEPTGLMQSVLLGNSQLRLIPLIPIAAFWTLGLVILISKAMSSFAWLSRKLYSRLEPYHPK